MIPCPFSQLLASKLLLHSSQVVERSNVLCTMSDGVIELSFLLSARATDKTSKGILVDSKLALNRSIAHLRVMYILLLNMV